MFASPEKFREASAVAIATRRVPFTRTMGDKRVLNVNVGILGHIDSGKTSLARALSTHFSTASLDKHPQSTERGITLDLGFSSFMAPVPENLKHLPYDEIQFTLVDCPGHASLIKTVLGGAQIIDVMMLVVDVNKGIQTQTAECLVVGEITTSELLVVMNKTDMIEEASRADKIAKMTARLSNTFKATKFKECEMVPVAARPGGAVDMSAGGEPPVGVDALVERLMTRVERAHARRERRKKDAFLFAVDHCFPIKGQGTVLTGTVLSGKCAVGDVIELPNLKLEKKVKSMQMFKRPVQSCERGDRLGMCITQLDHNLMERGLVASPGSVPTFNAAVVTAEKIRFFKQTVGSKMRFHVTVGHATVMATAEFFGEVPADGAGETATVEDAERLLRAVSLDVSGSGGADDEAERVSFSYEREYKYCSVLETAGEVRKRDADAGEAGAADLAAASARAGDTPAFATWAVLVFDQHITCPEDSLYIASRFDADIHQNTCRLAFHGRLVRAIDLEKTPDGVRRIKAFKMKQREGTVERFVDERSVIGKGMFKKETDLGLFAGMRVVTDRGEAGAIDGGFGKSGKYKVYFSDGIAPRENGETTRLYLRFKRYVFDKEAKKMVQ